MTNQLVGLVLLILLLTNCEKEKVKKDNKQINSAILFQHEYLNHAWVYQHTGWLVDSSGNVYCYRLPDAWVHFDSLGFITESAMINNISESDSICYKIDKIELNTKVTLINNASRGEISEPIHEMADAGVSAYYGLVYDSDKRTYKRILLKQIGDFRIENNSTEAKELYDWLNNIDKKIQGIK